MIGLNISVLQSPRTRPSVRVVAGSDAQTIMQHLAPFASSVWWDARDASHMLSGFAGKDGAVGDSDPAGVLLDRVSVGGSGIETFFEAQTELLTSSAFGPELEGWEEHSDPGGVAGWNSTESRLEISYVSGRARIRRPFNVTPGEWYRIEITISPEHPYGNVLISSSLASYNDLYDSGGSPPGMIKVMVQAKTNELWIGFRKFQLGTLAIEALSVRKLPGSHLGVVATGSQPRWISPGSLSFDGADDALHGVFSAGSLPSACNVFAIVRSADDEADILVDEPNGHRLLSFAQGDTGAALSLGAGSPTVHVNNGPALPTKDVFHQALDSQSFKIVEARGADLSAWGALTVSGGDGNRRFSGEISGVLVTDPLAEGARQNLLTSLASYYGVSML